MKCKTQDIAGSCGFAGKYCATVPEQIQFCFSPEGGDTQTARLFRCVMLWNWVTTRPRFSDRKNETLLYSLAALTTEACCDRREAAAQGAERGGFCLFVCFVFWCRGVFLPLESDALDWAAASNKHRCLKTCRCFTLCKKECGSSNHIVYGIRLRILFCFWNTYTFSLVLCISYKVGTKFCFKAQFCWWKMAKNG